MDIATIFGLAGAFGLMATAVIVGGSPSAFVDIPAILIVIGGTFCITTACFSFGEIVRAQAVVLKTVMQRYTNAPEAARKVLKLSEIARKEGPLGLETRIRKTANDPFLEKALMLVVDGTPGEEVERILRNELNSMKARHVKSAGVLRKAAEIAPAMGLIGTLIGLVQMLGGLDDPSTIGPAMAVALLTTFYGAILANMVFSPLAAKLERNSAEEALVYNVYLLGAASIGRQENPRRLEMLINTLLPPSQRIRYFQ